MQKNNVIHRVIGIGYLVIIYMFIPLVNVSAWEIRSPAAALGFTNVGAELLQLLDWLIMYEGIRWLCLLFGFAPVFHALPSSFKIIRATVWAVGNVLKFVAFVIKGTTSLVQAVVGGVMRP